MTNKEFAELLIKKIEDHRKVLCENKHDSVNTSYSMAHTHIIEIIRLMVNSVTSENSHTAYWIRKKTDKSHYNYYCSHCNTKSRFRMSKYCPECGYKMFKGEASHE